MKKYFLFPLLNLLLLFGSQAQTMAEIDSIFAEVNDPDRPAVAAAILYKGEVVYKKAFGRTHLDFDELATAETKFQLGGMSKHFTAFAIFLLAEEGKLSLDDDIRKHLPQLPEYEHTISIKHLLSLSSGLHGFWPLKTLTGVHEDDVFTQEHAMKLIMSQQKLGYIPGSDYAYTNTGQTLLAEIVASVSGQSFESFTQEKMFAPLGMGNTLFKADFEQYIPNVAASYEETADGFKESALNYGLLGPTNLYSCVDDLVKWELNMLNPAVGSKEMIQLLNTAATLNDGSTIDPTFGRLTLGQQLIHKERGISEIYQTGTLGGYASSVFKFTEHDFTVIVLSSGIPYSGYLGMRSAYVFLEDYFTLPEVTDFQTLDVKNLSSKALQKFEATYWDEKGASSRTISVQEDTLRYIRTDGRISALVPLEKELFQMMTEYDEIVLVRFKNEKNKKIMEFTIDQSDPIIFEEYNPVTYTSQELEVFTGSYYCKELNTVYDFNIKEGNLIASHVRNNDISFTPIQSDLFAGSDWFFGSIRYEMGTNGASGFWVYTEEIRNLWFEKL